jgi:hypothetical protein
VTDAERKRRQRLRENNGQAHYRFNFPAVDLEELLVATGDLHPWHVDSKDNVTARSRRLAPQTPQRDSVTSAQAI